MPLFSIQGKIDAEGRFPLNAADGRHLRKALRLKLGETFAVLLPDGRRGEARLEGRGPQSYGRLLSVGPAASETRLPLWLGIGIIRWERLEWLVEKAVELGVERLSPLQLVRGRLAKDVNISINKIKRLNKIAQETLKQCERIASTRIDPPMSLADFLRKVGEAEAPAWQKLLLQERLAEPWLGKGLRSEAERFVVLVGPEGGFQGQEREAALAAGFAEASLGPSILRSETAAIYCAAALDFHLRHSRSQA
ncbi:MAG: RsmE family RNA methyltransferase [bacterium]